MNRYRNVFTREELVNHLDIPEDIFVSPSIWTDTDSVLESLTSQLESLDIFDTRTEESDEIPPPLSDSEEEYGYINMIKKKKLVDPWIQMKEVLNTLPRSYIESLRQYQEDTSSSTKNTTNNCFDTTYEMFEEKKRLIYFDEDDIEKIEKFIDKECTVFTPGDRSFKDLEEGLKRIRSEGHPTTETDTIEDDWWRRSHTYSEFSISPPGEHLRRALARETDYNLVMRREYDEERCKEWVEENFLKRLENI